MKCDINHVNQSISRIESNRIESTTSVGSQSSVCTTQPASDIEFFAFDGSSAVCCVVSCLLFKLLDCCLFMFCNFEMGKLRRNTTRSVQFSKKIFEKSNFTGATQRLVPQPDSQQTTTTTMMMMMTSTQQQQQQQQQTRITSIENERKCQRFDDRKESIKNKQKQSILQCVA